MTDIPPYPLHWPEGLPRTQNRASSQFRTTLSAAVTFRDSVIGELLNCHIYTLHSDRLTNLGLAVWRALQAAKEWRCGGPVGFHVVDTSMEAGHNHCFDCGKPMPTGPLTTPVRAILAQEQAR